MYYFFHATDNERFINILKKEYIYASKYLPKKYLRLSGRNAHEYVYTNIFIGGLPLRADEKAGIGSITLIIDPLILKYKVAYFNKGWNAKIKKDTIIMNDNVIEVLNYLKNNYSYPYILTHEVLFKKRISIKFVIGIICEPDIEDHIRRNLNKYGYSHIKIFNKFPSLKS